MFSFTFLGTGCPVASPVRAGPAHLVSTGEAKILIDCGSGVSQRLVAAGQRAADIDALVITHYHSDHIVDFYQLLVSSSAGPDQTLDRPCARPGHPEPRQPDRGLFGRTRPADEPRKTPVHVGAQCRVPVAVRRAGHRARRPEGPCLPRRPSTRDPRLRPRFRSRRKAHRLLRRYEAGGRAVGSGEGGGPASPGSLRRSRDAAGSRRAQRRDDSCGAGLSHHPGAGRRYRQ